MLRISDCLLVCGALLGAVVPAVLAQIPNGGGAPATIATDRPAVTDSSAVVPEGEFQAENGLLDTGNQRRNIVDVPETVIRIDVGPSTEVRFTAPDYYQGSGFGDFAVGVKQQLLNGAGGFQVSAVVSLSFPTGANAVSSHGYDPSFQLPWSRALSSNRTAAGMMSVYAPTQNGSHFVIGESTFLIDRQLTGPWDAFVEYVGDFPQTGSPRHLLHLGTAYKIARMQQIDLHVGAGLSPAAVHHFIGIGYSFRFSMGRR
jgi:hypothetical protein